MQMDQQVSAADQAGSEDIRELSLEELCEVCGGGSWRAPVDNKPL